jgi:hypothetical protein
MLRAHISVTKLVRQLTQFFGCDREHVSGKAIIIAHPQHALFKLVGSNRNVLIYGWLGQIHPHSLDGLSLRASVVVGFPAIREGMHILPNKVTDLLYYAHPSLQSRYRYSRRGPIPRYSPGRSGCMLRAKGCYPPQQSAQTKPTGLDRPELLFYLVFRPTIPQSSTGADSSLIPSTQEASESSLIYPLFFHPNHLSAHRSILPEPTSPVNPFISFS